MSEAYKGFIDEMVSLAHSCVSADRIAKHGDPVRSNLDDLAPDEREQAIRALYQRLSRPEKQTLADCLRAERVSALHDFAAFLEWATSCDEMQISWKGVELKPFATMHHDFIGRIQGHDWREVQIG